MKVKFRKDDIKNLINEVIKEDDTVVPDEKTLPGAATFSMPMNKFLDKLRESVPKMNNMRKALVLVRVFKALGLTEGEIMVYARLMQRYLNKV